MEDYFAAKRLLFSADDGWPQIEIEGGISVINVDDPYGRRLADELVEDGAAEALRTFSAAGGDADFSAREVEFDATGSRFECDHPGRRASRSSTPMPGHFNVENALGALAAARRARARRRRVGHARWRRRARCRAASSRSTRDRASRCWSTTRTRPTRCENVLRAARRLTEGRLISVFGAGGDRDRDKRPLMGRAGAELSDVAVVTSDNPRSEHPEAILEDILAGIADRDAIEVEVDRRAAIALAFAGRARRHRRHRRQGPRAGAGVRGREEDPVRRSRRRARGAAQARGGGQVIALGGEEIAAASGAEALLSGDPGFPERVVIDSREVGPATSSSG